MIFLKLIWFWNLINFRTLVWYTYQTKFSKFSWLRCRDWKFRNEASLSNKIPLVLLIIWFIVVDTKCFSYYQYRRYELLFKWNLVTWAENRAVIIGRGMHWAESPLLTHFCPPLGAPEVPPLGRETSVSRTANVGTVGMNGLTIVFDVTVRCLLVNRLGHVCVTS